MKDAASRPAALLVVDDEEGMRTTLSDILLEYGFAVDSAGNGREAVDQVAAKRYDVVVMDVRMPVMDGAEALELIRERDPDLKVVMMSANMDAAMHMRVRQCADLVMLKPLNMPELLRFIHQVLASRTICYDPG